MPCIDRSSEFQRIVATRRAHQQVQHQISSSRPPSKRSEFAAAASQIGAGTALIADKLSKLTQLAQSQSLFEDPTIEINELTMIIKQDIQTINGQLASLQSAMAAAVADKERERTALETALKEVRAELEAVATTAKDEAEAAAARERTLSEELETARQQANELEAKAKLAKASVADRVAAAEKAESSLRDEMRKTVGVERQVRVITIEYH